MTNNNHPAHGPLSLDRLHQIREILSKAAAKSDGGNLGYAMADAVKVIDEAIAAFGAEPVLYAAEETLAYAKMGELHLKCLSQPMGDAVIPLYTAPPAPVVPDDVSIFEAAIEQCKTCDSIDEHAWNHGVLVVMAKYESCRAAMLQVGNHTEQHLDMVVHSGDAKEKVDCRLPFDQWLSQQNEPIDVDCGCITTEAFYHWLRVAYEAGNSPVTQDGLALVPKDMTPEMMRAVQIKSELGGYAASELSGAYDMFAEFWDVAVSAAPQQEVES